MYSDKVEMANQPPQFEIIIKELEGVLNTNYNILDRLQNQVDRINGEGENNKLSEVPTEPKPYNAIDTVKVLIRKLGDQSNGFDKVAQKMSSII